MKIFLEKKIHIKNSSPKSNITHIIEKYRDFKGCLTATKRCQKSRYFQIKQKFNPFAYTAEQRFICAVPPSRLSVIPASFEHPLYAPCRKSRMTRLIFWHVDQMFLINNFTKLSFLVFCYHLYIFFSHTNVRLMIHC